MSSEILTEVVGNVAVITLNKPEKLNAWDKPMRARLVDFLVGFNDDPAIGAVVLTGAGDRAFSAGQDFAEAKGFDHDSAESWIDEWERLYGTMRNMKKPIVAALNGVAAGSAFQVALLCDVRVGHPAVKMGQVEINTGIASVTGTWIMRELIGLARTTELVLRGRLVDADEAKSIGFLHEIVEKEQVMATALRIAGELAEKPPLAMKLARQWIAEMTEENFRDCLEAAVRIHAESYGSGEPARMMEIFLAKRGAQ